ncbi:MAG: phosphate ABC transporter substrate-binding protein PstS [Thiocapsa sp.]|uniref:phosphate ABC transporter substrate-binding protein PstS n=1 Tax=Thiocapsa sp. TaxID=2024551 RepID=UPI001BCFA72C|nr:phosphate ABC transporter substrate-binding protein PstS [Thiocapsa sp.]QVL49441.1 MAG: phosphate ABC transporter substrate-binding protein PstS [Thiocapsa sp.]
MTSLPGVKRAASAVFVSILLTACGGESTDTTTESPAGLRITGAGATFPEPLYQEWIRRYNTEQSEAHFVYEGGGSGEGVRRFIAETVDFGASDSAMSDEQIAQVQRGVKLIPATAGMIALAYNLPGVDGELRLPRDVYVDIFLGKVWQWNDPRIVAANPHLDLPSKLIQTVVRRDGSGTTFAFTNHLSTISPTWLNEGPGTGILMNWPGGAMTGNGNEGVAHKIKISHGSIGYIEYYFASRLGLPIASLENKAGNFVRPDAESGRRTLEAAAEDRMPENLRLFVPDPEAPDAYPIVSLTWLLLYGTYPEPEKMAALKAVVTWALDAGQPIAEELGYIPLPANIVSAASRAIETIR